MRVSDKGSVLVITLILMSVTMTLALYIVKLSKDVVQSYQMVMDKLDAKIEAESTVEVLKFLLSTNPVEKNRINVNTKIDENLSVSKTFYTDGREEKINNTTVRIYDTGRKINLLSIDETMVKVLFSNIGIDRKRIPIASDSYMDWIDKDDLKRLNGAERYYYRFEKKASYEPRNSITIQDVEELRLIRGFDKDYQKIKDYFFIYHKGSTNIYAAQPKVLKALLGLSDEQVVQIISLREKEEKFEGLEGSLEGLLPTLSEYISSYPNNIYEIYIKTSKGEAVEKLYSIIDFHVYEDKPFIVVKYVH